MLGKTAGGYAGNRKIKKPMHNNNLKDMLDNMEIGGTKKVKKKNAGKGNRIGKQLKAKKHRFSSAEL